MLQVIAAPAAYPVTRAEAKEWCRIESDDTSQDAVLDILIGAMTSYAEHKTGRAFVERTLELNLDAFDYCISLPLPPLLEVVSVSYTDLDGAAQTVAGSLYETDTVSAPGKVRPIWGQTWPSVGRGFNPVRIRYKAGYRPAASPTDLTDNSYLPAPLRTWIAARIATLYDQREQIIIGTIVADLPRAHADALLDPLVLGGRLF